MKFKAVVATLTLLATAVVAQAAPAQAAPVRPNIPCWYNFTYNEVDSTRIQVTATPQCSGEAAASMILWIYIPISQGNSFVASSNGAGVLTYTCTGGTAHNTFHLQVSGGSPYDFQTYTITDYCGPVEP